MPNQTRLKVWNSGETLTAADLNNEFDRALAGYNDNALDGDNLSTTATYVFGEVVIGTTITSADGGQLHIHSGSAGSISAAADFDEAVFENSTAAGITILSGNTSTGGIAFGDDGDADNGRLLYTHGATPAMAMWVDGTKYLDLTAATLAVTAGDITLFDDTNNADASLSIGTSATEALKIEVLNGAANKTAEEVRFTSSTASATAEHGKFSFYVDDVEILDIDDGGIDLAAGMAFTVDGAAVGLTFNNDGDNRVVTGDGSGGLNGEANFTFDGSNADITGTLSVTGVCDFADGAAATPTLVNTGDVDTGIFWPADNEIAIATAGSERVRVDASGYMGVGVSPSYHFDSVGSTASNFTARLGNSNATGPSVAWLHMSGAAPDDNTSLFLQCSDSSAVRCYIYSDGDLANHDGTYGTISDMKFKQDIQDMRSYWDDFKQLRYRKFRHKSDVAEDANAPYRLGLVAQEVETVFPSLVPESRDDPSDESNTDTHKWVKSSVIEGPIMASVVQELMARIEALENA